MSEPFTGTVNIYIRDAVPDWTPFEPPESGRKHIRNSMACITEAASRLPNASESIPQENG